MNIVRKITVKIDKDNVMHYQTKSKVFGGSKTVSDIIKKDKFFDIYVKEVEGNATMIWKSFSQDAVQHIEYETEL
jgi:hypothetical protein